MISLHNEVLYLSSLWIRGGRNGEPRKACVGAEEAQLCFSVSHRWSSLAPRAREVGGEGKRWDCCQHFPWVRTSWHRLLFLPLVFHHLSLHFVFDFFPRVRRNGSKWPSPHCLVIRVLVNINNWTYDTKEGSVRDRQSQSTGKKRKRKKKVLE